MVRYLLAGLAVLVCLLVASALVAFEAIRSVERNTSELMFEHSARTRLVDELQRDEDALTGVLYALFASARPQDGRDELLRQLDEVSARLHARTERGFALDGEEDWLTVRRAASTFTGELRRVLITGASPSAAVYAAHQDLVDALSNVATQIYQRAAEAQKRETERTQAWVRNLLSLVAIAIAIAIPGAILAIRSAVRIVGTMEWQAQELARLSARTMSVQEETARRFSRELHDQFGQTLTAIEANLVSLRDGGDNSSRVVDCLILVKDAIGSVRQISQLLRPSVLDDFGLDASLRWLSETFSQRTGVRVQYDSTFGRRLSDDVETQLFRIAQEALTNVARHSEATRVRITLTANLQRLVLTIADNGRGLPDRKSDAGTGLISMRARAQETGGVLSIRSARGQGVIINVDLPLEAERDHAAENPYLVGR